MSETPTPAKPTIRLLHHMARSGGTLISRCLGSMQGHCLLSEIHPDGATTLQPKRYRIDPLRQAFEWYQLIDSQDLEVFRQDPPSFQQLMWLIEQRASARGLKLIVRDWSHIDWIGAPFCQPQYESRLADCFPDYTVLRHCTVRHPIDQYLSLMKLGIIAKSNLTIDAYLEGMLEFSQLCDQIGFTRYEDLTHAPDPHLQHICQALDLDFDPGYAERWSSYKYITGDTNFSRGGAEAIRPLKRRAAKKDLVDDFCARPSYHQIKALLGYDSD